MKNKKLAIGITETETAARRSVRNADADEVRINQRGDKTMKTKKDAVKVGAEKAPAKAKVVAAVKVILPPASFNVVVGQMHGNKLSFEKQTGIAVAGIGQLVEKLFKSSTVHEVILCLKHPKAPKAKAVKAAK